MSVDYNNFAKTFSNSRKNMKWEEIEYFLSFLDWWKNLNILDIWCWNWRFLSELVKNDIALEKYLWLDLSKWLLDEAKEINPEYEFLELNMLDLEKLEWKEFDYIFFIASFHHLDNLEDRLEVLRKSKKILKPNWKIFMTNWSLDSELNTKRYSKSRIPYSQNIYWSTDYSIKLWEFTRYYHCFDLAELEYLFSESWFNIVENREFENKKNFVSIIKKIWD